MGKPWSENIVWNKTTFNKIKTKGLRKINWFNGSLLYD